MKLLEEIPRPTIVWMYETLQIHVVNRDFNYLHLNRWVCRISTFNKSHILWTGPWLLPLLRDFFGVFLLVQDGANSFAPFQKEVYEGVFGANIDAAVNLRQGLEDSISIGIESWKFWTVSWWVYAFGQKNCQLLCSMLRSIQTQRDENKNSPFSFPQVPDMSRDLDANNDKQYVNTIIRELQLNFICHIYFRKSEKNALREFQIRIVWSRTHAAFGWSGLLAARLEWRPDNLTTAQVSPTNMTVAVVVQVCLTYGTVFRFGFNVFFWAQLHKSCCFNLIDWGTVIQGSCRF